MGVSLMAVQTATNPILAKLMKQGLQKAHEQHKADDTTFGFADLPPDINGVALFTEGLLKEYKDGDNKGKPYLSLTGIVCKPDDLRGARAPLMINLFDGTGAKAKKFDERVAQALNEMRKLGVDTKGIKPEQWETALKGVAQNKTYFRFRTWKGEATKEYPNPRVQVDFQGKVEGYKDDGPSLPAVNDNTGGDGGADSAGAGTYDWEGLGVSADGGDASAVETIQNAAKGAGLDPDAYQTWSECAAAVAESAGGGGDAGGSDASAGAEETPWKPEKDDVFLYQPPGKGEKKVEVQITAVFENGKCNAKEVAGKNRSFKGITWSPPEANELKGE
jgi:hypothetical protein